MTVRTVIAQLEGEYGYRRRERHIVAKYDVLSELVREFGRAGCSMRHSALPCNHSAKTSPNNLCIASKDRRSATSL